MIARFNSAGADVAQSYLLITILAAILGGVDPYGGFGGVGGLFVALWILQVVASGFNLMNVSPQLALASWGLILLLVMAVNRFTGRGAFAAGIKRSRPDVGSAARQAARGSAMNRVLVDGRRDTRGRCI